MLTTKAASADDKEATNSALKKNWENQFCLQIFCAYFTQLPLRCNCQEEPTATVSNSIRQKQPERTPLTWLAINANSATMRFDNQLADGQT
jgi:hypothetical protein